MRTPATLGRARPLYLATASTPAVRRAIRSGAIGQIITPAAGHIPEPAAAWCIDNGAFTTPAWTLPQLQRWSTLLDRYQHRAGQCLWVTVPDVVGDAAGTDELWGRWWSAPMRRGYRAAYVAQNGCRWLPAGAAAVFLGGSDRFKLGPEGRAVARATKDLGKWLHMGRVNSLRRLRYAVSIGCDSVDGTYLAHGPDTNLPRLLGWLRALDAPRLFDP